MIKNILATTVILLLSSVIHVNAQYKTELSFDGAIDQSILAVQASTYKNMYVATTSGHIEGEFVQKTKDTLILKEFTGNTHMKTGKEKVMLKFIKLEDITFISVYVLE